MPVSWGPVTPCGNENHFHLQARPFHVPGWKSTNRIACTKRSFIRVLLEQQRLQPSSPGSDLPLPCPAGRFAGDALPPDSLCPVLEVQPPAPLS